MCLAGLNLGNGLDGGHLDAQLLGNLAEILVSKSSMTLVRRDSQNHSVAFGRHRDVFGVRPGSLGHMLMMRVVSR